MKEKFHCNQKDTLQQTMKNGRGKFSLFTFLCWKIKNIINVGDTFVLCKIVGVEVLLFSPWQNFPPSEGKL